MSNDAIKEIVVAMLNNGYFPKSGKIENTANEIKTVIEKLQTRI